MPSIELSTQCNAEQAEALEHTLFELGALSVTFADAEDQAILEPAVGEMPLWRQLVVTALFGDENTAEAAWRTLRHNRHEHDWHRKTVPERQWERAWMTHFKPMRFGRNTWVVPQGFEPPVPEAVNLSLDPGLAFGTGSHATTALCLEWIDQHDLRDRTVMDFGCGSGILAIAALLHGAREAWCTDIDPQAIEATQANAAKNGVADRIRIVQPEAVEQASPPDILMANILAAPLIDMAPTFARLARPGCRLVLSGILREQTDEVITAYTPDFVDITLRFSEDWALLSSRRSE